MYPGTMIGKNINPIFNGGNQITEAKITAETARIQWTELAKFYAAGQLLTVSGELDLIEVAFALATDQKAQFADWLAGGLVHRVTDDEAIYWHEQQRELWAVVISPWILVQDKQPQ